MKLTTRQAALFGILGALTFAAKVAMMGLPNIEPVSLIVMLFSVTYGRKALYPIYVYVLLEFTLFGFHLWSVNYLYVWAILAGLAWLFRSMSHPLGWALLSGAFGLFFGALCAPVYLFTGGPAFAFTWWASGIPFDLTHAAGNFAMALLLFCPLRRLFARLERSAS
ncbi:MAG: hypothetical protein IIV90_05390 [Oscillospiraceae bacterium]|nr:hypothetical protein [Oscillospiraceae bacterium]